MQTFSDTVSLLSHFCISFLGIHEVCSHAVLDIETGVFSFQPIAVMYSIPTTRCDPSLTLKSVHLFPMTKSDRFELPTMQQKQKSAANQHNL
jgi:hypothetical protein